MQNKELAIKERKILLRELIRIEDMSNIISRDYARPTLQKRLKQLWRGRFFSQGAAKLEVQQERYARRIIQALEDPKQKEQIQILTKDLVQRASRYVGSIPKLINSTKLQTTILQKELDKTKTSLLGLITIMNEILDEHSDTSWEKFITKENSITYYKKIETYCKSNWPTIEPLYTELERCNQLRRGYHSERFKAYFFTFIRLTVPDYNNPTKQQLDQFVAIFTQLIKSHIMRDLGPLETYCFFFYIKNALKDISTHNIDTIYSIDKSGRVPGALLYAAMRETKIQNIKKLFLLADRNGKVTFYSKKYKQSIENKNILLIDDTVHTGSTIEPLITKLQALGARSVAFKPFAVYTDHRGTPATNKYKFYFMGQPSFYTDQKMVGIIESKGKNQIVRLSQEHIIYTRIFRRRLNAFGKVIINWIKITT